MWPVELYALIGPLLSNAQNVQEKTNTIGLETHIFTTKFDAAGFTLAAEIGETKVEITG